MIPVPLLSSGSNNSLIFNYTALGVLSYDPSVTTSRATIVKFKPDDAPETVIGPSTVHAFSYVPSAGNHSCRITVVGGLCLVTSIDSSTDGLTSIKNIEKCRLLTAFVADVNPLLQLNLSSISAVTYYVRLYGCPLVQGNLSSVSAVTYYLDLYGCPLVQGNLSSVSAVTSYLILSGCSLIQGNLSSVSAVTSYLNLSGCSLVQGNLSSVSAVTYYLSLSDCPLIQGNLSSVSAITYYLSLANCSLVQGNLSSVSAITYHLNLAYCSLVQGNLSSVSNVTFNLSLYSCSLVECDVVPACASNYLGNMSKSQGQVDAIIENIYQTVLILPNFYPAAHPLLSIITDNATPSGVYQFSANPQTGLEKVYFICHTATHSWTVVWNGGSAP